MKLYWYAPFDNASELELAEAIGSKVDDLLLHSVYSRFGVPLPRDAEQFTLVRNLPAPANELYRRSTWWHRARVALSRARLRQKQIVHDDYDIVHLHTFNMFTDWVALRLLRREGRPLVLSIHNVRPHDRRGPRTIETLLHRSAYSVPDHLIVAHASLRDRLAQEFRIPPDRVSVVPLPSPTVPNLGNHPVDDPKELLFFGTLRSNKGIDVLLDAIARIPLETPAVFRFAGRGDRELEDLLLHHASLDPRILVEVGWIPPDRQAELYARAWAVVVPYLPEFVAQSGTVRVAYSFGTPVLASDTGALGETIRQDDSGWLAQPGDANDLAAQMLHVLDDHDGRHSRAAIAKRLGEERNARNLAPMLMEIYEGLSTRS